MALISVFIKKSASVVQTFDAEDTQITTFGVFATNAVTSDTLLGSGTTPFGVGATTQSNVYTIEAENTPEATFTLGATTNTSVYTLDGETIGVATFGVGAQAQYA